MNLIKTSLFSTLFICTVCFAVNQAESVKVNLPNNNWVLGSKQSLQNQSVTEYVPTGESVNNWQRIITVNYNSYKVLNPSLPLSQIVNLTLKSLKDICPMMKSEILKQTNDSITYQWQITGCGTGVRADQIEIARLVRGKTGFFTIHYAIKSTDVPEPTRQEMLNVVTKSQIEK